MSTKLTRRGFTALAGAAAAAAPFAAHAQQQKRYAMLVRVLGNTAFELAHIGGRQAAEELGAELIFTGPTANTAEGQVQIINSLIAQRVDAIMLSANDATALTPSLKRAARRGATVVTWDQDTEPAARDLFVASATNELIALGPAEIALDLAGGAGKVGIITGPANSTTQNIWVNEMIRLTGEVERFKGLEVTEVAYGDERSDKAYNEALGLVNKYPEMEVIVCYTSVGLAAAAQMVLDEGLVGKVKVTGLGFPNEMADYVTKGAVPAFAIWDMIDVGYTTLFATHAVETGAITGAPGETFEAGRMGTMTVGEDGTVVMGKLKVYDTSNVVEAAELIRSLQN